MKTPIWPFGCVVMTCLLTACGGGGGGGSEGTPPSEPAPEGFYQGTSDLGYQLQGVVLDDGEYYVLYGETLGDTFASSDVRDFDFTTGEVNSGSLDATFTRGQNLTGKVTYEGGGTNGFSAAYDPAYEQAPSLAEDAGDYHGQALNPSGQTQATVTLTEEGQVSGSDDTGCTFSGAVTARDRGDVYDLKLTFGATPCLYAKQILSGIAYAEDGRLVAAMPNDRRDGGVFFIGEKAPLE